MRRRTFLAAVSAVPLTWALAKQALAAGSQITASKVAEIQQNWQALLAKDAAVTLSTAPLQKTEAEWKQLLSEQQFNVLRREGTEHPFTSPLNGEKRAGVFVCAGCNLPLFTSQMKYDSGTGWPSFFTSIPGHLDTKKDLHLILPRTEYHCIRCGGHQGHVFDDGPPPTGQRWCNNGIALRFVPAQGKA